jgi:hypothetical protein
MYHEFFKLATINGNGVKWKLIGEKLEKRWYKRPSGNVR